jgi:hypothetical protein
MTFHLRDMVDLIGRKLIAGDVLELQHLKDYDPLNNDLPAALKRYYVVGDASFASEGFSPTWWPHLWRVKLNPLVDSQEYKDILNNIAAGDDTTTPVGQVLSTYQQYENLNTAIVAQAEFDVPVSGYDTTSFYTLGVDADGEPQSDPLTADLTSITADQLDPTADSGVLSPSSKIEGYLTGDGTAPNGLITGAGIAFPTNPLDGDYFLRLDYLPNRLFRFDGSFWRKIEDAVRTNITPGAANNQTVRNSYVNNTNTYTDNKPVLATAVIVGRQYSIRQLGSTDFTQIGASTNNIGITFVANAIGTGTGIVNAVHNERQNLSVALTPRADNPNTGDNLNVD